MALVTGKGFAGFVLGMTLPTGRMHIDLIIFRRIQNRIDRRMAHFTFSAILIDMFFMCKIRVSRNAITFLFGSRDNNHIFRHLSNFSKNNAQAQPKGNNQK